MPNEYFVFLYVPGPGWLSHKPITEQPLSEHFAYMERLTGEGILVLGGPFKDDQGAIGVLEVANLAEAREVIDNDPAVRDGIFQAEVHPWHPAVPGQVEVRPW